MTSGVISRYRRDTGAVSPVIGEVMIVAIVVVLAAVVWLMVSGMIQTDPETTITATFRNPTVEEHMRGATPTEVWDARVEVVKVIPDHVGVDWDEITITMVSVNGSLLHPGTKMTTDTPGMYDTDDSDGIDVQFWYVDTDMSENIISGGDFVKITGMDIYHEGATIKLSRAGELLAQLELPQVFQ